MAIKKSQIYSSLWSSCDALRGGMDASQYKDYILTLLFLKYISDRSESDPEAQIAVPAGCRFADLLLLRGDKEIGEKIDIAIQKIADANELGGVINNASFNNPDKLGDGKDMVARLSDLLDIFSRPELDFRKNRAEGDDILGDAYEYLMRHFAADSGKSKGQFYTPAEVSRIMAEVVGINKETKQDHTIYDPTCGSGSLLIKAADAAPNGMSIYGQEKDNATFALARMNMVIHNNADAEMARANTITQPKFKNANDGLKTFDFVVANPPFSDKAWSTGLEQDYGRFEYGMPPAKNGDYAYLLHVLASLKSKGKAVVVMPHGVLFRGNAEAEIRKKIIHHGFIKGIIGLPANLFYGTSIPACLIVLDKENANARAGIFMVDASKGFVKDGNKNRLRHQDVHKIVDVFQNQREIDGYSRMVPVAEIRSEQNDCNLNIPRYIDSSEEEDLQDIEAHLKGGIPKRDIDALEPFWKAMPNLRDALFSDHEREGYLNANHAPDEVRAAILEHPDFAALTAKLDAIFNGWRDANRSKMAAFDEGAHPKDLIHEVSEDLLSRYSDAPLIDRYDAYQHVMTYWSEIMQDDCYLIAEDGWKAAKEIREVFRVKEGSQMKWPEQPDILIPKGQSKRGFVAEIVPPNLVRDRFFADEKSQLGEVEATLDAVELRIVELDEEHSGEDGFFADCRDGKGKITVTLLKERRKELVVECEQDIVASYEKKAKTANCGKALKQEFFETIPDFLELMTIDEMLRLNTEKGKYAKAAREAKAKLNQLIVAKYLALTDSEMEVLVVEDKWLGSIDALINREQEQIALNLTGRISELIGRYREPLPKISALVVDYEKQVIAHLRAMGFADD
ncbi:type I restriction-modification system subunit M [Erythrobacter sp. YT30]|uniref:type I restriction-modification system subunit M n=1 Tax=Erythrobacter sp. YT30 TaxID=1735012 RepID=UPI00076D65A1|nr:type I restriction-modification system subunit M [Erythrobacter sp. YT30]KWV91748.1 type I restriction endonuclease subunit M [Erythrobacter sp. YT30]